MYNYQAPAHLNLLPIDKAGAGGIYLYCAALLRSLNRRPAKYAGVCSLVKIIKYT